MQGTNDYYCFAVFDPTTKQLLYSKFNFDFEKFKNSNASYATLTNNRLFYNFLVLNETNLWEPFVVKEELKQYFLPITQEIKQYFDDYNYLLWGFNFNTLTSYSTRSTRLANEFNLYYYDYFKEIPSVCEFLYYKDGVIYSKYNFKFEEYSQYFKTYGSKIAIFYDFLIRLTFLSGNAAGFIGFKNIPDKFKQFFYLDTDSQNILKQYLEKNSVYSPFTNSPRSPVNIDYIIYSTLIKNKYNITFNNIEEAKKYFLKYGQFQQDEIPFILSKDNEITEVIKSLCIVTTSNSTGSGFLINGPTNFNVYRGVKQIFLITCYHLIENSKKDVLYASCYYNGTTDVKLMFRIIGFDIHTDLCIAMYDDTLDYNNTFFPEIQYNIRNSLKLLDLYGDIEQYLGQQIITVGNPGFLDNASYMEGKIMDPLYCGNFDQKFTLNRPPTILTNMHIQTGQSGSPLFIRDSTDNKLKCIGMLNAKLGDNYQFSTGLSSHLLRKMISNGILYWFNLINRFGINDIENISYYIQDIFPKKWLGIICTYYNPSNATKKNAAFSNFTLNGGVIVTKFILGFNVITQKYISNVDDLSQQGVIKLDTPLLKTKMYQKFIFNNRVPIVIKSLKLFDLVNGLYQTFNIGKYPGQSSMDCLTYGLMQLSTVVNDPKYTNLHVREYSNIIIEFYYYNGRNWVLEIEEVGGNSPDWFNEYQDSYGHVFLQHKFDFPAILLPYLSTYYNSNNEFGGELGGFQEAPCFLEAPCDLGALINRNPSSQFDQNKSTPIIITTPPPNTGYNPFKPKK